MKKEAASAKKVYLATDPDREGEAIAWHLAHILEIDETKDVVEDNTPAILNAELFKKCGFFDIPTQTQLIDFYNYINIESENLKDFDLLGWWDNSLASAELLLNINALPYEQSLETNTVKIPYSKKVNLIINVIRYCLS